MSLQAQVTSKEEASFKFQAQNSEDCLQPGCDARPGTPLPLSQEQRVMKPLT